MKDAPSKEPSIDFEKILKQAELRQEALIRDGGASIPVDLRETLKEHRSDYKQANHDLRHQFARRIFSLLLGWIVSVMFFAFLQGSQRCHGLPWYLSWMPCRFELQTPVIIALFASTTASIVGLFVIVARWLFNPNKDD